MPFGGPPRDGQLLGDLAIAPAVSHQDRHLQLSPSELPELCAHQPSPAPLKHSRPVVLPVTPSWIRPSVDPWAAGAIGSCSDCSPCCSASSLVALSRRRRFSRRYRPFRSRA